MIDRFPLGNTIRQLWNNADRYAASQTITTSADISQSLPESALVLEMLEGQIQLAAKRLANATGANATSLESLVDELERYGTGGTYLRPWQLIGEQQSIRQQQVFWL